MPARFQGVGVGHAGNHQVRLDVFNALELVVVVGLFDDLRHGNAHVVAGLLQQFQLGGLVALIHVGDADFRHRHAAADQESGQGNFQQVVAHEENGLAANQLQVVFQGFPDFRFPFLQSLGLNAEDGADFFRSRRGCRRGQWGNGAPISLHLRRRIRVVAVRERKGLMPTT